MEVHSYLEERSKKMERLIEIENEEESSISAYHDQLSIEDLEEIGYCIQNLKIEEAKVALYGKTLVKFAYCDSQEAKNSIYERWHKFTQGDVVGLIDDAPIRKSTSQLISGIVYKLSDKYITICFQAISGIDQESEHLVLREISNHETYKRCLAAAEAIGFSHQNSKVNRVRELLVASHIKKDDSNTRSQGASGYGFTTRDIDEEEIKSLDSWFNTSLNVNQKEVISYCLNSTQLSVIHGPPGTGKTTTVVELLLQTLKHYKSAKILC